MWLPSQRRFIRGLFVFLTLIGSSRAMPFLAQQTNLPIYATLGPEAPAILRVLIDESRVIPIQPGGLADLLKSRAIDTLVLPEDWADSADIHAARAAGVSIFLVQRHTSVSRITANITTLAKLTHSEAQGNHWIDEINKGLAQTQDAHRQARRTRVLLLTPEGYTQGQGTLFTELVTIAGGTNVAAEAGIPEARQIEDTQIRDMKPDVVLLIGWTETDAAAFRANPLYQSIVAFDRSRVYRIAAPGKDPARLVQDVQRLTDLFHPPEI